MIKVFCDGGARGNPGPAACAYLIYEADPSMDSTSSPQAGSGPTGNLRYKCGKYLGVTTNNAAEYTAVSEALAKLEVEYRSSEIAFFLDSTLVVNQLNGKFQIKNIGLKECFLKVKHQEKNLRSKNPQLNLTYSYIPREQNAEADLLVNQTLDSLPT